MVKAAVLHQFDQPVVLGDIEIATVAPSEVRVRTAATGICHSDRHGQTGGNPALGLPAVLGHEAAGVVVEVGANVSGLVPGDHVVVAPAGSCGTCAWCSQGLPQHCTHLVRTREDGTPRLTLDGRPVAQFVGIGSFAEEMLVQASSVAKVPAAMPLDKAALLGCAVITGLGAVRHTAGVRIGDTVAVVGCGGVGLSAVQGAALAGAARIVAIDRMPEKLELARQLGATDVVDASATDPVAAVRELTGGVDHALEMVGLPATIAQAFAMLRTRGTATVVGLARPGDTITLPALDLLAEKRLQGSRLGGTQLRVDVPLYAEMYLAGRLDLDLLQGATVSIDGLAAALDGIDQATAARTIVTF
ncbi:zinc-binding dehydrogenase [Pimelobacter simplex]|uniref:Alcohol dehydrogenase n=1 Tax=Nocardioides simplex TaxID=2045 RepID=A0A0A1DS01_NOCSI|nr:zinc-binding dehydrogenase [Pimelobacter simplex]AIY20114.2 Alcohol dehydrogenase [Pimelobacter simplex]GEB14531.1 alcohol dehydrogenase [Pimelobacter simplex]SFM28594.1 S-(hydroxymethyl)glutathione dehydrogenase / alcohol dehydrogenase [Pimelobacter simplex]